MRPLVRLIAALTIALVAVAGCGGGDEGDAADGAVSDAGGQADQGDRDVAADSGATAVGGSVDGPVVTGLNPGIVDPEAGEMRPLELPSGFPDTSTAPVGTDDTVYVLGIDFAEDSSERFFTVWAVERATGAFTAFREFPGSETMVVDQLVAVDGHLWIATRDTADDTRALLAHDLDGTEVGRVPSGLSGTGVGDGDLLYFFTDGGVSSVDVAGNVSVVLDGQRTVGDAVPDLVLDDHVVLETPGAISPDVVDSMLGTRLRPSDPSAFDVVDGVVWYVVSRSISSEEGQGHLFEAVVRHDPASGAVELFSLGDLGGRWITDPESPFDLAPFSQPQLAWFDGALYLADRRDDGMLLRLDPDTGEIAVHHDPTDPMFDRHEITLLRTDPTRLWVTVNGYTVVQENEDGSRSSSIDRVHEAIDPATGEVLVSAVG